MNHVSLQKILRVIVLASISLFWFYTHFASFRVLKSLHCVNGLNYTRVSKWLFFLILFCTTLKIMKIRQLKCLPFIWLLDIVSSSNFRRYSIRLSRLSNLGMSTNASGFCLCCPCRIFFTLMSGRNWSQKSSKSSFSSSDLQ